MSKLTNQELFDIVARHLMKQGKRAGSYVPRSDGMDKFVCMYRSADDYKCAAGAILPDEKYNPLLEGESVRGVHCRPIFRTLVENVEFLAELQLIHDTDIGYHGYDSTFDTSDTDWPVVWKARLRKVADDADLDAKVLDEPVPA